MALSEKQVREYAQKHGITEAAVRDIAGIKDPVVIEVTAKIDGKNPGLVHFEASDGFDGVALVDVGGSEFAQIPVAKGKFTHSFSVPGFHRVRVDLAGVVRWLDVVTGVNTDTGEDPVAEVPAPIGTPDFSQSLLGVDTNVPADAPVVTPEDGGDSAPKAPRGRRRA
jgi:hypothetical protein